MFEWISLTPWITASSSEVTDEMKVLDPSKSVCLVLRVIRETEWSLELAMRICGLAATISWCARPCLLKMVYPQSWPLPKTPQAALGRTVSFSHFWILPPPQKQTVRTGKCLGTFGLSPLLERGIGDSEEGRGLAEVVVPEKYYWPNFFLSFFELLCWGMMTCERDTYFVVIVV